MCTGSWLSCDRGSRSPAHRTDPATASRRCQSQSRTLWVLEYHLWGKTAMQISQNKALWFGPEIESNLDEHLPSVRTTIHWIPSPKDLWLSGTHLWKTAMVKCSDFIPSVCCFYKLHPLWSFPPATLCCYRHSNAALGMHPFSVFTYS